MAKKKNDPKKEMIKKGFESNEKPKTPQEQEIERLLNLGKVNK